MFIAIINDNQIVKIGHYKELFSEVSFPPSGPDADFMLANNALGVTTWKAHNKATQKLITVDPYIEDNQVFTVNVIDKTEDEITADITHMANVIRATRTKLLQETDWTQVNDSKVDTTAWATYRQLLRDITAQEGFPFEVIWPALISN